MPLTKRLQSAEPGAPLFVDVGGGQGAQWVAFREATKTFSGRVVLQDLPETLAHAPAHECLEKMTQNFFDGQGIKGK